MANLNVTVHWQKFQSVSKADLRGRTGRAQTIKIFIDLITIQEEIIDDFIQHEVWI